ncbi:hypothetical protein [Sporotomaculum syntrophicum]|uniref:hypothetical protein n=1 Tax=Sporotomaculum syntrophicum TaxID=182264 RepID=UPI001379D094|nr:hypothetical protein [Sporotomaculum syntrophicum]
MPVRCGCTGDHEAARSYRVSSYPTCSAIPPDQAIEGQLATADGRAAACSQRQNILVFRKSAMAKLIAATKGK